MRIFDAPKVFLTSLKMLCGIEGLGDEVSRARSFRGTVPDLSLQASRPMAANVPPLGLSNRAIASEPLRLFASRDVADGEHLHAASAAEDQLIPESDDPYAAILPVNFTVASHPPFEEQLLGSTLWPEARIFPPYHRSH